MSLGLALLFAALRANHAWLARHFLPEFFGSRAEQRLILDVLRLIGAGLGVWLMFGLRAPLARALQQRSLAHRLGEAAPMFLAVVLALGASEILLRRLPWFAAHELSTQREPLRRRDPELGWIYLPDRTAVGRLGGRKVEYAFDAAGRRVRAAGQPIDHGAPAILFAGESIVAGHGLQFDETIPAQVEAMMGAASANLGVGGYATDQAYLRLRRELPRFERPLAVVILFMPALFHRNLDTDRPHLVRGLAWRPAEDGWKLAQLARRLVPYKTDAEISDGVAATQEQLRAVVEMARARGAVPLIVTPQLTPETEEERALRRRILDEAGLPYLFVPVDPDWRLPRNRHPDARGARRIAAEVARALAAGGLAAEAGAADAPKE